MRWSWWCATCPRGLVRRAVGLPAGLALAQIQDERLYRMEYDLFEAYCQVKFQYGRGYIN